METPNNHKAIQVENLKTALDEWKHVVVKVDSIINTEDPIKRASCQVFATTCLYAIFYLLSVSILIFGDADPKSSRWASLILTYNFSQAL